MKDRSGDTLGELQESQLKTTNIATKQPAWLPDPATKH
jgi:hypothetical protein